MARTRSLAVLAAAAGAFAQQRGNQQAEVHPSLTTYNCDATGDCTPDTTTTIVLDANWRWTHAVNSDTNCYTGDNWDTSLCPDPVTCSKNCALEGAAYEQTYGITTAGDDIGIKLVTVGQYDTNIGARTYVMDSPTTYKQYKLKNREFAFTADVSTAPCGVNGALYFVDMTADGGASEYPLDQAGAAYGTGYCDAQCPRDIKFIGGLANIQNWIPSPDGDPDSGWGQLGSCCTELDIFESNSISSALTPHMCTNDGPAVCNDTVSCGDGPDRFLGLCDKDGCDINPYRGAATTFYGPGFTPGGVGCNVQNGVNQKGAILAAPTIVTDVASCCSTCNATAGCAAFTYVTATAQCFLFSSVTGTFPDAGAASGTVAAPSSSGAVDTTQKFTVVTQFITSDGTDAGDLVEIRRFFVQNGVKMPHPVVTNIPGNYSSITDAYCKAKGVAYSDNDNFEAFGGLKRMGEVMDNGMVLVLSQWVDYEAHMLWLDSTYPTNDTASMPGAARGTCATSSGVPSSVIANSPDSTVHFSAISQGPIGFTEARLAREAAAVRLKEAEAGLQKA